MLLAAGCSASDGASDPPHEDPEPTQASERPRELRVGRNFSNAPGQGPREPKVILAPSASALSRELGAEIPDRGEGTYLISYGGEKPTGGYSLRIESAVIAEDRVTIRLGLEEPPPDTILTQALTYVVVAVVRDLDLGGKSFSLVHGDGRELDWPVRRVDG